jgi:hypothetical protein
VVPATAEGTAIPYGTEAVYAHPMRLFPRGFRVRVLPLRPALALEVKGHLTRRALRLGQLLHGPVLPRERDTEGAESFDGG